MNILTRIFSRTRRIAFWLAWPFWFVYFKLVPNRTRVLVVADSKVLVVRTWLDGESWGLPGGGVKRGEALTDGAIRELQEETGLAALASKLEFLESRKRGQYGLRYTAHYYLLRLNESHIPKRQLHEIAEVRWCSQKEVANMQFNVDARYGLDTYQDKLWYNE